MNVWNFILANWDSILAVLVFIAAVIYLIFRGEKGVVLKMLYALVTEAEKTYGGGTGSLKLATVIETVYPKLPALVRMFINVSVLEKWIDAVLAEAKKTWESNSSIAAYIEQTEKPPNE